MQRSVRSVPTESEAVESSRSRRWLPFPALALVALVGALSVVVVMPGVAQAKPVFSRSHHELAVPINDCGIGTLQLSIDNFFVTQFEPTKHLGTRIQLMANERGTGIDLSSGASYHFLDHFTQALIAPGSDQPFTTTAERTLVITGGSAGGMLARQLVHMTVLPDGTVVSDHSINFLRCL